MNAVELAPDPITIVPRAATHVWLVDDDREFRGLLAGYLQRQDDIRCVRDFPSPDGALSALASQPGPDVIVMDVHMGDRNGLDAISSIKALSRHTQVLMLTSLFDDAGKNRALSEGASDFLLKSYTPEEIVERIRNPSRRVNARRRKAKAACPTKGKNLKAANRTDKNHPLSPANVPSKAPSFVRGSLNFFRKLLN